MVKMLAHDGWGMACTRFFRTFFFENLSFMPGVFFPNRPAVHHCGGSTVGDLKNSWGLTCQLEVMKPDSPRSVLGVIQEVCRGDL